MDKIKVALVTGANKGIGFETARQLAEWGVHVYLGARDLKKAADAAARLGDLPVTPIALDVNSNADIFSVTRTLEANHGRLDILINNAGVLRDIGGWGVNNTPDISLPEIRETFDTNFFGVVALTQSLLPLLRKSAAGRIVNVSSVLGSLTLHSSPEAPIYTSKLFAYDASKTALNAFTVHLAHALKDTPIKVNSAHPGWVQTDLGGEGATDDTARGAYTSVSLALLGPDGPTGKFFFRSDELPW